MGRRKQGLLLLALMAGFAAGACGGSGSRSAGGGNGNGNGNGENPPPPPAPPPPPPPGFVFGTQGPWPVENVVYGAADGIKESPVVGMTTDEAQNRWVATQDALYLLRPGDASFHRYDENDGLHLRANRLHYCNGRQIPQDRVCSGPGNTEAWGSGLSINTIVGGGEGEVFVGYHGLHPGGFDCANNDDGQDWCDPDAHSGKIDRVRLNADGTLTVDRFDLVSNNHGGQFWHNRDIRRLVFDHLVNKHTLYAGAEHGVTMLLPDKFRLPNDGEWFDAAYKEWMADHLHARVCKGVPCVAGSEANQRMGDWNGLALDEDGNLWHAGKWTAGLITFVPDPVSWYGRNGAAFATAFGDPYHGPGSGNPPVFEVAAEGDNVYLNAVSVCPDGTVWFGSDGPDGVSESVASFDGRRFHYYQASDLGLPERSVKDLVCLPDGRVVLASTSSGLSIYDPATRTSRRITAGDGTIPSNRILSLEVDRMPSPFTLHVATGGGAAALRVLP
jgi:hypothetical protein